MALCVPMHVVRAPCKGGMDGIPPPVAEVAPADLGERAGSAAAERQPSVIQAGGLPTAPDPAAPPPLKAEDPAIKVEDPAIKVEDDEPDPLTLMAGMNEEELAGFLAGTASLLKEATATRKAIAARKTKLAARMAKLAAEAALLDAEHEDADKAVQLAQLAVDAIEEARAAAAASEELAVDVQPLLPPAHRVTAENCCSICPKRFASPYKAAQHERTHTTYACSMCPKRFGQKSHVAPHERSHTGEKPYACSMCPRRFARKSHVTKHERTHTGE